MTYALLFVVIVVDVLMIADAVLKYRDHCERRRLDREHWRRLADRKRAAEKASTQPSTDRRGQP